jgi:hypothetical protein
VVPHWMPGAAAQGRHEGVPSLVFDTHERRFS